MTQEKAEQCKELLNRVGIRPTEIQSMGEIIDGDTDQLSELFHGEATDIELLIHETIFSVEAIREGVESLKGVKGIKHEYNTSTRHHSFT